MAITECESWLKSIDLWRPPTLRLRRLPRLSKSSMWQLISRRCMACDSVTCCTWHSEASWQACVTSSSSTLSEMAYMSERRSDIAADRVLFIIQV